MAKIQSNASTASTHASSLMTGANALSSVSIATKDTSSEYPGNSTASEKLDQEATIGGQIASRATEFIGLVQSVATEFVAVDAAIASSISASPAPSDHFVPDSSLFAD